jgi:hypothetical protein
MSGKCSEKRDWKTFSANTIASELRSESYKKKGAAMSGGLLAAALQRNYNL